MFSDDKLNFVHMVYKTNVNGLDVADLTPSR